MYCEWYGDFVVLSVVDVCADYGAVNVLILASSMVLGFVSMSVLLLYVVCFLRLGGVCCVVM